MPGSNSVTYSKILTNVSVAFQPAELVAFKIFKRTPVAINALAGLYPVFDKTNFRAPDTFRTDGTEENEANLGWRDDYFKIEKHGLKDFITDDADQFNESELDQKTAIAEFLKQQVLNTYENQIFGTNGIIRTAANNGFSDATADFRYPATMTSREPVKAASLGVYENCGRRANTIALAPNVIDAITASVEWNEARQYTSDQSGSEAQRPTNIWGLNVIEVGFAMNMSQLGQPDDLSFIMGDDVWIGYVNPADSLTKRMLSYGVTLWTKEEAREWYEKGPQVTKIAYDFDRCAKVTAKEAGALLQGVLS